MSLECVTVESGDAPVGSVIWMHGLGADAHDFEPIIPMLNLNAPLRFVFPNAPTRQVTMNGGAEMRAWYDIDPGAPLAGQADIKASTAQISEILEGEIAAGTPASQITLAGFSQGGVIALELGLAYDKRLAGIMALSTYVHDHERLAERIGLANIDTPIFMAHGLMDPMIPLTRAVTCRDALLSLNYSVEWRQYGMGHQVCPEEINHISDWLNVVHG